MENERKWNVRYWIKTKLTDIIRCSKDGLFHCAKDYVVEFRGMLMYMQSVGDISEEIYNKIYNLTNLLVKKYDLY